MQIAASIVRDIVYSAVAAGAPLAEVVASANLNLAELQAGEQPYDLPTVAAVWAAAVRHSSDPLLGLHVGEQVHFEAMGIVGFVLQSSPDVGTALKRGVHYANIYSNLLEIQLEITADAGQVAFVPVGLFAQRYPAAARQAVESSMAFVVQALSKLSGRSIVPISAQLQFPGPAAGLRAEYERILRRPMQFDAPASVLSFARPDLEAPVLSYNAALFHLLDQEAARQLQAYHHQLPFRVQARQALAKLLQTRYPSMEELAQELAMSTRTLQRKLRDEHTTYQEVLETLQQEVAVNYLGESSLTVAEIAYLLGYSEPGVFTRAFKRWTGQSPSAYRQQEVT